MSEPAIEFTSSETYFDTPTGRLRAVRGRPFDCALQYQVARTVYIGLTLARREFFWMDVPVVDSPEPPKEAGDYALDVPVNGDET